MQKRNGFTLLEVLIVVVIAVSVTAFAVPAYKKSQDKNKYLVAQGVLLDLGTAVRAIRTELASGSFPSGAAPVQVTADWHTTAAPSESVTSANAKTEIFARQHMAPIPFDNGNEYKSFVFFVCPDGQSSGSYCCNNDSSVVACMYSGSLGSTSATAGQYWGAAFMEDGSIKRLTK